MKKLRKKLCKKCCKIGNQVTLDTFEVCWNFGFVVCVSVDEYKARKITSEPPANCPFLLEQTI